MLVVCSAVVSTCATSKPETNHPSLKSGDVCRYGSVRLKVVLCTEAVAVVPPPPPPPTHTHTHTHTYKPLPPTYHPCTPHSSYSVFYANQNHPPPPGHETLAFSVGGRPDDLNHGGTPTFLTFKKGVLYGHNTAITGLCIIIPSNVGGWDEILTRNVCSSHPFSLPVGRGATPGLQAAPTGPQQGTNGPLPLSLFPYQHCAPPGNLLHP